MSTKNISIVFPGLNNKEVEFAIKHLENPFKSFLTLIIVLVWRGQIAYSQSLLGVNKKELLSIPSMKYTSKLISTNIDIQNIAASVALFRTSAEELRFSNFISLSVKDRDAFIRSKISELLNSSGSAKILTSRQISSPEDLLVHRRGLFFQIKSILQYGSVFDSGSLINGSNILYIGKYQIVQLFSILFREAFNDSLDLIKTIYTNYSGDKDSFSNSIEDLLNWFIIEFLFDDSRSLHFQDGIIVSVEDDNLLLIEKGLPIVRNKPSEFPDLINFDPGDDLFLKAAFLQLKNRKKELKTFSNLTSDRGKLNVKLKN